MHCIICRTVVESQYLSLLFTRLVVCIRENIVGILKDELRDGGCAGIIVNTVRRAQRIYEELSSCMTEVRIILCHAQMLAPDRLNKEKMS